VKADNGNSESRVGAFFGLVAGVLVLALTAMAFYALDPPREQQALNWEVSAPKPSIKILPGF
jgi:hypothetical protein